MDIPVIVGGYQEIIAANPPGADQQWFTNDHSFIQDESGTGTALRLIIR